MCGIVGYIGQQAKSRVEVMNGTQIHRGPDSGGVYVDDSMGIALAMRRLAIVDIAGGDQPMVSQNDRYVIVYNGEIFNAPDLKKTLEESGVSFETDHSDTEVLFQLLIREGKSALPRLNGMFAFAFYDLEQKTVLIGRDRFGIKPLYYTQTSSHIAFASEMKSLCALVPQAHAINRQAFYHYLSLQYVAGEQAIFEGIKRLPAGHYLEINVSEKRVKVEKWWQPRYAPQYGVSRQDWVDQIRETLQQAVMRWSLSDVPLAISLSGGLDSSAIAGICAQNDIKLQAYSLGFSGEGEDSWNELPLARKVAEKWGLAYHETVLKPEAILDRLEAMVSALDEPYGGGLPSWFIYEAMQGNVKVAHTGTGGDELFGNYGKWQMLENRFKNLLHYSRTKSINFDRFKRLFVDQYYYFRDEDKLSLLSREREELETTAHLLYERFISSGEEKIRDACAVVDITTQLGDEFLLMTDRFSMAHSIEARTPFLDNELFDLVRRIPAQERTNRRDLKGLLREAVTPFLPAELLGAPKKGFVIPLGLWMRHQLRDMVEDLLGKDALHHQGLISPEFYEAFVKPHLSAQADHTNKLWTMLMFQLWYRRYA